VFEFLHPDDLPSVVTGQAGLDGGEARTFEARVRQSDAGYRWIAARVRPVLGDDGRVHELVAGWRDIHDEHVAREALAASEQQYRLLAENASDVVYRTDLQARCVWISPSVKTTLGWEPNELLGRAMVELVHPDDLAEAERLRKAAEDAGVEPEHQQRRYLTADGRWRWMLVVTRALHGEDGTPVGGVAALRDVHEQVLAQQAVEASRRRTQALFEGHASVMLVVEPATGTIVAANAAAARFYGYPQTVLAGMAIDEINILPADEVAARRAAALAGEHNSFLFPHRLADGHIRTVEVHSSPIKDGERTLLFSIIRDVTDEVAAHGALTAAKERYRQLALNATDVVFHTDREGVFEWVSESVREVVGWTPEELVGTPAAALAHPDDVTALVDTATRVAAGERVDYRARYRTADGGYRWLDVAARPVLDGDGEVVGRIGAGRDVTDEVELQAALAASEALYRGVTVALHEGIVVHARDGRIVQANARAQEILGLSVEQMMGRTSTDPPWRAVHEDGSPFPGGTHPAMVTLATGTPTRDVVMGVHKPDGTLTWTLVNAEPLPGLPGDGHGPGVVASFTDITGLRLAQHAVREQREHLQATLDSLLDPHAAWEPVRDEQGAVVDFLCLDMNRAALADQDVTRDQIVGRGLMEVFPGSSGAGMFEQFRQVAETGVPWSVDDFPYDNELVGPQRRYDMHAILVGTELRVTWRDVTDQVEAAEQLAKSRLEYRLLAENAADVVLRLDEKGRTAWIAPAVQRLLGYPPQEMLGETRFDLVHPGDESGVREALERLTAGIDETVTVELRLRHRHGGYVWWEATGRFVDDHGGGRQVVVAFRDVDERVHAARTAQAEQERRQAVVDSMLDPLLLLGPVRDLQGHVVDLVIHDINNAACDLFGRPRSAVVGTALSALFDGPAVPVVIGWCRGVLATGTPLALDGAELVSDLTHDARWYDVRAVRVEDSVSLTWRDVTEAHQARDAIERQARMDALTGLANRREALTRLEQMLGHDPRTGHRIAVAFCDLDDFKTINDEHGHGAGDEALQVVAARVAALVRDNDLVARIGGDEILVVLDGVRDLADAQSLAEKIRQVARLPIPVLGGTFDITLSVGVTLAKTNEDVDALIARADRAMYEAKNTGKDRVVSL
jgi:diguanylate cyclase (GGDEF)-like protein/PAS domain S-box-containing protein